MSKLQLSDNLSLPPEAITETFGILAVRGAGKSNTAAVMAEEMFRARLPFVAVDPVGAWWGLRSSKDGKGPGIAIPIFGGKRGDVPLEKSGGNLVADLIVDQRLSCVLDISHFDSENSKKAFLLDFARRLYLRNELPLHLFLEEADDYIPQRPMRDEAQLLRAWENIVRRGRARGLGMTLITQRSASINKNVLTQVQTLIAMRTTSPQDRAAIADWLKYHAQSQEILESLPSLAAGEAWVWSPIFLEKTVRVRFNQRHTFDSGATPKTSAAAAHRAPATLADVNLADIQQRMAATIEKAKADDPKELRKRISGLERELAAAKMAATEVKTVEVPVLSEKERSQLVAIAGTLQAIAGDLGVAAGRAEGLASGIRADANLILSYVEERQKAAHARPEARLSDSSAATAPRQRRLHAPPRADTSQTNGRGLGKCERAILAVLADRPEVSRSKRYIAVRAGYAISGGGFNNALSSLRTSGLIEGSDLVRITSDGLKSGTFEQLPTGQALAQHWIQNLGRAEGLILRALIGAYPDSLDKEDIASQTGYEASGGGFNNAISKLRTLELIEGRGELRASGELF